MEGDLADKVEMHNVPVWMFIESVEIIIRTDARYHYPGSAGRWTSRGIIVLRSGIN
jgi:hypothetical protein